MSNNIHLSNDELRKLVFDLWRESPDGTVDLVALQSVLPSAYTAEGVLSVINISPSEFRGRGKDLLPNGELKYLVDAIMQHLDQNNSGTLQEISILVNEKQHLVELLLVTYQSELRIKITPAGLGGPMLAVRY